MCVCVSATLKKIKRLITYVYKNQKFNRPKAKRFFREQLGRDIGLDLAILARKRSKIAAHFFNNMPQASHWSMAPDLQPLN